MTRFDEKYKEMFRLCSNYHELIDKLRDQAYGYETSLDIILPFEAKFTLNPVTKKHIGINEFCNKMVFYCSNFTSEAQAAFKNPLDEEGYECLTNMLKAIIFYLHSSCNKDDYTFNGFKKILKSFLGEISDEDKAKDLQTCVFWIMYGDISDEIKKTHPEEIQEAFKRLFDNYNYNHLSDIADKAFCCIRFFLYENNYDYMNNKIMNIALSDLIKEITDRLRTINDNCKPRSGWRSSGNE